MTDRPLLEARDLVVTTTGPVPVRLVDGVSFALDAGEALGLVGESGSGKSLTLRSLVGLLPAGVRASSGSVLVGGADVLTMRSRDLRTVRGRRLAMIFQDPMTALNPVMTVGDQIAEAPRVELGLSARTARRRAVELMEQVGIPDAARRSRCFPHEFSGGMRQRVMIAIALACTPEVLLCDEPTTALDVTTQAQILEIIDGLRASAGLSVVFVTHDLAVVAQLCERVAVMYSGQIVESGRTDEVFRSPRHAYTLGLLRSAPDLASRRDRLHAIPGLPPAPGQAPSGCRFAPRCAYSDSDCAEPVRVTIDRVDVEAHTSICVHPDLVTSSVAREPVVQDA